LIESECKALSLHEPRYYLIFCKAKVLLCSTIARYVTQYGYISGVTLCGSSPFLHMTALFAYDIASYAGIQKGTVLHKK